MSDNLPTPNSNLVADKSENILDKIIIDPIEELMDKMGMMQGEYAPLKRAAFGSTVGAALTWTIKPTVAFEGDKPRPWKLQSKDPDATYITWWMLAMFPGVILGVFI